MTDKILEKLQELTNLTLIGVKQALTMDDCVLFTGLSKNYIYKLVSLNTIPYYKGQGGKITYFNKEELTAWMLQHRVKTKDEIETEVDNYIVADKVRG